MRNVTITRIVNKSLRIPNTAEEWELYDYPDADAAAHRIADALEQALLLPTREEAEALGLAALEAESIFGACDTEPQCILFDLLDEAY